MSKNTSADSILKALHAVLADHLKSRIESAESLDAVPAAVLKEAREFLKDNGIDADGMNNQDLNGLAASLLGKDTDDDADRIPFPVNTQSG